MILKKPEVSWENVRDVLVQEGFEEYYQNEWYSHLRKGKNVVGIPKLEIIPLLYLEHIISGSGFSEKEFLGLLNIRTNEA